MSNRYRGMSARGQIAAAKDQSKINRIVILIALSVIVISPVVLWAWFGVEVATMQTKQDELIAGMVFNIALIGSVPLCLLMTLKGE